MGKVLGGGSSINVMAWSRGHKNDWEFFASEAGDPAWNYESVLNIYRRIEDWHGTPDPKYRGSGGPVYVQPAPISNPIFPAVLEGARAAGIPTFENPNGRMQEGGGGCSIQDIRSAGTASPGCGAELSGSFYDWFYLGVRAAVSSIRDCEWSSQSLEEYFEP
jgi:choline dehydrogenase